MTKSEGEQGQQASRSVFDFLYHDARRVGLFLSQFEDAGHLQQVKRIVATAEGSVAKAGAVSSIGLPKIAGFNAAFDDQATEERRDSQEKVFDPLWANTLALLDHLAQRDLLRRGLDEARIGDFVLVRGRLAILDAGLLRGAWQRPAIRDAIRRSATQSDPGQSGAPTALAPLNRKDRRAAASRVRGEAGARPLEPSNDIDVTLELLGLLPHSVQARLDVGGANVWCGLREDALVTAAGDILLKHGVSISGEWAILGILDALPEEDAGLAFLNDMGAVADTVLGDVIARLATPTRLMLGRPHSAYGVTPLLIFREVAAAEDGRGTS